MRINTHITLENIISNLEKGYGLSIKPHQGIKLARYIRKLEDLAINAEDYAIEGQLEKKEDIRALLIELEQQARD